jgi:cytochrome b6-f complex iron-sulfur subunit
MSAIHETSRRAVIVGSAAGVAALGACSSQDEAPPAGPEQTSPGDGGGLVAVDDVPVGGAVVVEGADGPLVVSQPSAGDVVAFSAVCTHQGCTVQADGAQLRCPCHGSVFESATGANISGPAPSPLPAVDVHVVDGQVRTA